MGQLLSSLSTYLYQGNHPPLVRRMALPHLRRRPGSPPENLAGFKLLDYASDTDVPIARSGHRIFVDNDNMYVIGGFRNNGFGDGGQIIHEMWQLNLVTQIWKMLPIPADFPTSLASFACVSDGCGSFLLYGGTGSPFGSNLDEHIYLGEVRDDNVRIKKILPRPGKSGVYGHVLLFDHKRQRYVSIGGTDGTVFRLDVHVLEKKNTTNDDSWGWRQLNSRHEVGLYRMEAIVDDDHILLFGGGTPDIVQSMEELLSYDLEKEEYITVSTYGDPVHGYPEGRRCHGCARFGRTVVITGGCSQDLPRPGANHHPGILRYVQVRSDSWAFNLDTYQWRKLGDLSTPVYFHDSVFTKEGRLMIFGGVTDSQSNARTNATQTCWIEPPSLFCTALAAVSGHGYLIPETARMGDKGKLVRDLAVEEA